MTQINKLSDIVDNGLCIGCGLCQSITGKDSIEIAINIYWDVSGGMEEKQEREKFLLNVIGLAQELELTFFEPRIRRSGE